MTPAPDDEIYPPAAHVPGRAARLLRADLELLASPPMVWMRLVAGAILCVVFGGGGVFIAAEIVLGFAQGGRSTIGMLAPVVAIGSALLIAGSVVGLALWTSFQAYRRNGLI
jgi:hypothetical protein